MNHPHKFCLILGKITGDFLLIVLVYRLNRARMFNILCQMNLIDEMLSSKHNTLIIEHFDNKKDE